MSQPASKPKAASQEPGFRVRQRLSSQLAIYFLLISLIPLTTVIWFSYQSAREMLLWQLTASLRTMAERQAKQIEGHIAERVEDVRFLAGIPDVRRALANYAHSETPQQEVSPEVALLADQLVSSAGYRNLYLVAADDTPVYSFLEISSREREIVRGELGEITRKTMATLESVVMSFPAADGQRGRDVFFSAPVRVASGVPGIVILETHSSEVFKIVGEYTGLGQTGATVIAAGDGDEVIIINHPRHGEEEAAKVLSRKADAGTPTVSSVRGGEGAGLYTDYRGADVVAAWRHIPGINWGILVKVDADEAFAPISRLRSISTLLGAVTATVVLLTALLVSKSITDPIRLLTEEAQRIASGDLGREIPVRGRNEVGQLGWAFSRMAARLKETISDLRETTRERENAADEATQAKDKLAEINRTLEEKVADRTRELSLKNERIERTLTELNKTQGQLIMQEKMASLGQLTAGIAHEIKNPLNFVMNLSTLSQEMTVELRTIIQKRLAGMEPRAMEEILEVLGDIDESMTKIHEHGKRADSIVRGMLLHSRGDSRELAETNLNDLLKEYVNLAYHGMRARDKTFYVKLAWELDEELARVRVVPQDIGRVILNVATNACYALRQARARKPGDWYPELRVISKNADGKVELRIRDNGPGIEADQLDKIFQPFYTTKPAGEGTGLGLSISYQIVVKEHFGEMLVYTEPGNYTEFLILLPRDRPTSRADIPKLKDAQLT